MFFLADMYKTPKLALSFIGFEQAIPRESENRTSFQLLLLSAITNVDVIELVEVSAWFGKFGFVT